MIGVKKMTIGEILRRTDVDTYMKLKGIGKHNQRNKKAKKIRLGDRPENLMKHDAYKRVRGALRQIRWG